MDLSKLRQFQLTSSTDIKPFKCADDDLTEFLFEDAKYFQKELLTVTYLLEYMEMNQTVAYYSLLADKIIFNPEEKGVWNKLNRNIPNTKRRRSYPAVKIGRLAVNEIYTGTGLGTFILDNIKYAFANVKRLGCRFITVDALKTAVPFYEKNGFQFLQNKIKMMLLV